MTKNNQNKPQISIFQPLGNNAKIRVRIEGENVWLTQKLIAELFEVSITTVKSILLIYSKSKSWKKSQLFGISE
jgi:hypothetical protein